MEITLIRWLARTKRRRGNLFFDVEIALISPIFSRDHFGSSAGCCIDNSDQCFSMRKPELWMWITNELPLCDPFLFWYVYRRRVYDNTALYSSILSDMAGWWKPFASPGGRVYQDWWWVPLAPLKGLLSRQGKMKGAKAYPLFFAGKQWQKRSWGHAGGYNFVMPWFISASNVWNVGPINSA